ncbi:MAG: UvrD-helicase domain-containing protein [Candidatus Omnitrophica bacterium]|nr:UvrD-helicase domain-containing protein [Candidatus Omnitrophota bacterium]
MSDKINKFEFPEVRVVDASAGSGKTYALAKRYVQLLLMTNAENHSAASIRSILALTFTNKAAFEMKRRILLFLRSIALGVMPQNELHEIISPLGLDAAYAQRRALEVMEDIIRNYDFFQVDTIDTFINGMLSGCAFKLGVSSNFKIKTSAAEYLELSLDRFIDNAFTDPEVLEGLNDFLHGYLYIENRSGWFPKKDMLAIISGLFKEINIRQGKFLTTDLTSKTLSELRGIIMEEMRLLKTALPIKIDKRFVMKLNNFLDDHKKGFDIDSVPDWFAREEIPASKGSEVGDDAVMLWNLIRDNLRRMCVDEATSLFNPYVRIFDGVWTQINELTRREDVVFLSELNRKAAQLLRDGEISVEELAMRLTSRYQHYLLDEFQDTSRLQWSNINGLVREALSKGGSFFYVGDKKQAIYRFRGGDVTLFDDVKDEFKAFNIQIENLDQNRRSSQNIVEFNNQVFSMANLRGFLDRRQKAEEEKKKDTLVKFSDKDIYALEKVFGSSSQKFQASRLGGYVKFEYIDDKNKEVRDEILKDKFFAVISDVTKRYGFKDIAVLTRTNSQSRMITDWLLEVDIPVESDVTLDITQHILIRDICSFLKFLNSPVDNLAFSSFILSEVFLKASGMSFEQTQNFLLSLRDKLGRASTVYIYTEFRRQFPEIWSKYIEEFFKNVGLYPVYELLVSIYRGYDILEKFPEQQGFFMHFLELVKKQEAEYSDLGVFLKYFDELAGEEAYVHISGSNAVKVMTIHKAKGLEFPVVIIPYLTLDVEVGAGSMDNKMAYVVQESDEALQLLRLKKKYYNYSDELYQIYAKEYKKEFLSELNNIYVALTRASNEMYGFIPSKVGSSNNSAMFLLPDGLLQVGDVGTELVKAADKSDDLVMIPPMQNQDWIKYLSEEFLAIEEFKYRKGRKRGEIIHAFLDRIIDLNKQSFDELVGKIEEENFKEAASVVAGLVGDDELKHFFYLKPGETAFNEQEIVDKYGHSKRIDRIIIREDSVDVIDYKSGEAEIPEHKVQVMGYVEMVSKMFPNKKIDGYLIYVETRKVLKV